MKAILLLLLCFTTLANGQTMGDLFKAMPSELLPGLSDGNKTMLLVDTGQTSVPYALGEVKKRVHNDDHLLIQTSNVGTIELKLLPVAQDSIIICVIRTVCAQACDSRIDFYTTGWEKIDDSTLLPPINREIFFDSSQKERENYKYAVSLPGIYPVLAKFSDNGTDLLLAFDFKEHLDEQQIAEVLPFLKSDTIVLKWDRVSFKE
ncbi:MAG: DUF3256 family protein [Bacteroidota bacterium]|jgi:hypothetical protein|nr:DUF3256 family protein [Bacteroidota bacterium]